MTKFIILFIISIAVLSCGKNKKTEANQTASLTPFEMTIDSDATITTEDRQKLADAKGRSVQILTISALEKQIREAKGNIHLFYFWKLADKNSLKMNETLEKIALQMPENIQVKLINLDDIADQKSVNTYLRATGITAKAFQLQTEKEWTKKLDKTWSGQVPYLLLVNQDDGTFLPYQQNLSYESLYAILQTLI